MKKTIKDIDVKGKKVFVRCDFNVPTDESGAITDDRRIRGAVPTIEYLANNGAAVIIASHMGRPKGKPDMKYSLGVVATRLEELLGRKVQFVSEPEVTGEKTKAAAAALGAGEILLIENVRFREEETKNDPAFSKELASLADIFVNDAFGTAHRAHSSTAGIADYLPAVSGFLMEKEIRFFGDILDAPKRPFTAVLGGAKVGDKIPLIENLIEKVDTIIVGGGMAYTFFKAMGYEIGTSLLEEDKMPLTLDLMKKAEAKGVKFMLPVDVVVAPEFKNDSPSKVCDVKEMPVDMMGLDIGPQTRELFRQAVLDSATVVWNGPMGVFEMDSFAEGTKAIAIAMNDCKGTTVVGGGDSAAAVQKFDLEANISHISTGGGASLEFLEGKVLPGVDCLLDA
jgi:phosphoglycerate kinase